VVDDLFDHYCTVNTISHRFRIPRTVDNSLAMLNTRLLCSYIDVVRSAARRRMPFYSDSRRSYIEFTRGGVGEELTLDEDSFSIR